MLTISQISHQCKTLENEEFRPKEMNVISLIVLSSVWYLWDCFCEQTERFPESSWCMIEFFWFHIQPVHLDYSVLISVFCFCCPVPKIRDVHMMSKEGNNINATDRMQNVA